MKEIVFYVDQIQELFALKKVLSIDSFYDRMKELLKVGQKIVIIVSSFEH